jgi:hypothetical protein
MTPTKQQIKKEIKRLRTFIDDNNKAEDFETLIKSRAAYLAETLLRWTLEDTEEWNLPLEEAIEEADIILQDIEAKSA